MAHTIEREALLSELDRLTHDARLRRVRTLAQDARGSESLLQLGASLETADTYEAMLALELANAAGERAAISRALAHESCSYAAAPSAPRPRTSTTRPSRRPCSPRRPTCAGGSRASPPGGPARGRRPARRRVARALGSGRGRATPARLLERDGRGPAPVARPRDRLLDAPRARAPRRRARSRSRDVRARARPSARRPVDAAIARRSPRSHAPGRGASSTSSTRSRRTRSRSRSRTSSASWMHRSDTGPSHRSESVPARLMGTGQRCHPGLRF